MTERDKDVTFKLKPTHMTLLFKEALMEFFNPNDVLVFITETLLELTNPSLLPLGLPDPPPPPPPSTVIEGLSPKALSSKRAAHCPQDLAAKGG